MGFDAAGRLRFPNISHKPALSDIDSPFRFGSQVDMCSAIGHVRFTPNSDREIGHVPMVMSALPPKADVCGIRDVRFGPIADIN